MHLIVFKTAWLPTYEEDPIRKCFFSIVRDEVNHEEVCQRAIQALVPDGPLGHRPETPLGHLAINNIKWYYHNGCRYWSGFKNGVGRWPLPILFTSFLMGEVASATLFHSMYQRTTIPVFREAFRRVGQDEARHMGICLTVLEKVLPKLNDEQRAVITKQLRAGFIFLSGILYLPGREFWELGPTFMDAHLMLEDEARGAGIVGRAGGVCGRGMVIKDVVQHLGDRGQAVGGARGVRNDGLASVFFVINAIHKHGRVVFRWRAQNHLLGASGQVSRGGFFI